jgi:hypothetical protein
MSRKCWSLDISHSYDPPQPLIRIKFTICFHLFPFYIIHRPVFYKLKNITFREVDLFPSSGDWKTITLLDRLEILSDGGQNFLRHPTESVSPTHLKKEADIVSEALCSLLSRMPGDETNKKHRNSEYL